jgi:hypothetical protein
MHEAVHPRNQRPPQQKIKLKTYMSLSPSTAVQGKKSKLNDPLFSSQSSKSTISLTAISTQSLLAAPPSYPHRPAAIAGL